LCERHCRADGTAGCSDPATPRPTLRWTRWGAARRFAPRRKLLHSRLPMYVRLSKTFRFEAAHDLPTFPEGHKCRRLHGHSFSFDVVVAGDVDPAKGYLIDYGDIKQHVDPIVKQLDHYYLNEIEGLSNPTSEMLAVWLWNRIKPHLPDLAEIIVYETCTSRCEYRG
jgi:6-pyruvoyltetrahydropterin/6-carboxytetrahydropterin synthase